MSGSVLVVLTVLAVASSGCATRERVVVRERPVEVVRVVPAQPVVVEKVVVHP